jgi:HEPN domain-containing protein
LLQQDGLAIPDEVREAGRLTRFAVETRYPGLAEPVGRDEYERAVSIAETVVRWAAERIESNEP